MASNREAKIKFTAETGEFNSNIAKANSTLSKLRSELKLNATEMKNNGESAELLSQRQEILAQEANASQQKIDNLTAKLEKAKQIFGENSIEVDKLATQLNNARTAEAKIQAEIEQVNSSLAEQESASREADSALNRLEGTIREQENAVSKLEGEYKSAVIQYGKASTEARQLETQLSKANSELQESKSKMEQAEQAARELAGGLDKAATEAGDLGTSVGDIAAGNMLADFAGNAISSLTGLEEATRQYRSEQAKLESIAQTSGQSVGVLKDQYQDLYAITADETLSSTAVANLSAMGLSAEDSGKLIHAATGIWAQYGDSIPLDGLMESVNETASVGTVTGNLADALNWAKINEDEFNEKLAACSTEQERQQLIIDTLNGKYGNLADSYSENNSSAMDANRAAAELTESQAKLSEEIAPLQTAVTNLAADGLAWLADNFHIVTPLVAGFSVALAGVWLVMNGATIIQTVTGAFAALNAVMAANPIGIVIAVLAGLVVAFIGLWNNCEGFRNFWIDLWDTITQAASDAWKWIKKTWNTVSEWFSSNVIEPLVNIFTELWENLQEIWDTICNVVKVAVMLIGEIISAAVQIITIPFRFIWENCKDIIISAWNTISSKVSSALNTVKTVITNVFNTVRTFITNIWNSVSLTVSNAVNKVKNVVSIGFNAAKNTVSSVFNSIRSVCSNIWNSVSSTIGNAVNSARNAVSSAFNSVSSTVSGVFNSVLASARSTWNSIKNAISTPINAAKSAVSSAIDAIKSKFNFSWSLPKLKLPHISIKGSFSLTPPSAPSFGISWYKDGGIMTNPTLFGMAGNTLLGGGEAGPEAILPLDRLQNFIDNSFARNSDAETLGRILNAIEKLDDGLGNKIAENAPEFPDTRTFNRMARRAIQV